MSRAPAILTTAIVVDALLSALFPLVVFLDVSPSLHGGLALVTSVALAAGAARLRARLSHGRRAASLAVVALSVAALARPLTLAAQYMLAQHAVAGDAAWPRAAYLVEAVEAIGLIALATTGMRGPSRIRTIGAFAIALVLVTRVVALRAVDVPSSGLGLVIVVMAALLAAALAAALLLLVGRAAGDDTVDRDAAVAGLERAGRGLLWAAGLRVGAPFLLVMATVLPVGSTSASVLGLVMMAVPLLITATGLARASAWSAPAAPRRRFAVAGLLLATTPAAWLLVSAQLWFELPVVVVVGPRTIAVVGLLAIAVLASALTATARLHQAPAVARRATVLTVVVIACHGLTAYLMDAPRDSALLKVLAGGMAMTIVQALALLLLRRAIREVADTFAYEPPAEVPTAIARVI